MCSPISRQSGAALYRFADLRRDGDLLECGQRWAGALIERDPELSQPEHVLLGERVRERFRQDELAALRA